MKSGLALASEQEKLWCPFETALNDLFTSHTETMQAMAKAHEGGARMTPPERMALMGDRMAERASRMKAVGAASKPLYAGLNDDQKHRFDVLSAGLMSGPEGDYAHGGGAGFSWEPEGWGGPDGVEGAGSRAVDPLPPRFRGGEPPVMELPSGRSVPIRWQ